MLKTESAQNVTKLVPLRSSHLPDSNVIFTSSNGLHMQKISRSVRKPKQAKKGDSYIVRTDDVVALGDDTWQLLETTRGSLG
jgi:hypothetical protein